MNKQEAIEKVKEHGEFYSNAFGGTAKMVPVGPIIDIIYEIHEPQKVVVPAFIDNFIRYAKAEGMSLYIAMDNAQNKESEWIVTNEETFVRAWYDGYQVEKESLYTVDIPNPVLTDNSDSVTVLTKIDSGIVLTDTVDYIGRKQDPVYQLTESEIKKDFDWAWQFAEEVE